MAATAAVIGLGSIGAPVAVRLAKAGISTRVVDLRDEACGPALAEGATRATSPAEGADGADLVAVAVVNDAQVEEVLLGERGVLSSARDDCVVAIHSTVRLDTVHKVAAAARERGVSVLDAGVSIGGAPEPGLLHLMVGGDEAALNRVRAILEKYSHRIDYAGPQGAGMAIKIARNLTGYLLMVSVYEGVRLAERAGADLEQFRRIVKDTDTLSFFRLALDLPTTEPVTESEVAEKYAGRLTGGGAKEHIAAVGPSAAIMEKDVDQAIELARTLGFELELGPVARDLIRPSILLPRG